MVFLKEGVSEGTEARLTQRSAIIHRKKARAVAQSVEV